MQAPGTLVPKELLFKTKLCSYYQRQGFCHRGEACKFAHGGHELQVRPSVRGRDGSAIGLKVMNELLDLTVQGTLIQSASQGMARSDADVLGEILHLLSPHQLVGRGPMVPISQLSVRLAPRLHPEARRRMHGRLLFFLHTYPSLLVVDEVDGVQLVGRCDVLSSVSPSEMPAEANSELHENVVALLTAANPNPFDSVPIANLTLQLSRCMPPDLFQPIKDNLAVVLRQLPGVQVSDDEVYVKMLPGAVDKVHRGRTSSAFSPSPNPIGPATVPAVSDFMLPRPHLSALSPPFTAHAHSLTHRLPPPPPVLATPATGVWGPSWAKDDEPWMAWP